MAYLNSVLLEGEYVDGILYGSFHQDETFLPLMIPVKNVPDEFENHEIRIIGRVAIDAPDYIYVLAEHTEKIG